jgi:hypothetical protein
MKRTLKVAPLLVFAALAGSAVAEGMGGPKESTGVMPGLLDHIGIEKSASASTVGARGFVGPVDTMFGGFEINQATTVYILVRGNSLGALGITNGYLDAPHVRLYNQAGTDLITQSGFVGFNDCLSSNTTTDLQIINYYAARGIPVQPRDTCLAAFMQPGTYTFSVTPSVLNGNNSIRASGNNGPAAGQILFEVKLGP